jgi:predicted nucleotidyltransferase
MTLKIGATYYIPKKHLLTQVRGIGEKKVRCGRVCKYFNDTPNKVGDAVFPIQDTVSWELIENPYTHPALEKTSSGFFRVIKEKYVHPEIVKATLAKLAIDFRQRMEIDDVYVFGSVARTGTGNDLDIIVTVSEYHFRLWAEDLTSTLDDIHEKRVVDTYMTAGDIRMLAADRLLGIPDEYSDGYIDFSDAKGINGYPLETYMFIDIFLFPEDWKQSVDELQSMLPNKDPNFMRNIAKEAIIV